jgi:hypothetical protein
MTHDGFNHLIHSENTHLRETSYRVRELGKPAVLSRTAEAKGVMTATWIISP